MVCLKGSTMKFAGNWKVKYQSFLTFAIQTIVSMRKKEEKGRRKRKKKEEKGRRKRKKKKKKEEKEKKERNYGKFAPWRWHAWRVFKLAS